MKTGDKVATVFFWMIIGGFGLWVAGDFLLIGIRKGNPWFIIGALIIFVIAAVGARECMRSLKGHQENGNAV